MSKEQEHPIKWLKSKAQELLLKDLFDIVGPLNAKDENNKTTMPLKTIYKMRPEFQEYLYKNFLRRLASLREIVKKRSIEQEMTRKLLIPFVIIMKSQCFQRVEDTFSGKGVELKSCLKKT